MSVVVVIDRVLLAVMFAVAGLMKLRDPAGSRRAVREFGIPAGLAAPVALLLPLVELGVAGGLDVAGSARWAAGAACVLLGVFVLAIALNLARGRRPTCNCFGQLHSRPVSAVTLLRNLVLLGLAAVIVAHPSGVGTGGVVALAIFAGVAFQVWVAYQLLRQNGRILIRLSKVEQSLVAPSVSKLPVGSPAPYFSLPALDGSRVTLESLLAPGHPLLLAFVDPGCGPCVALLPRLASWQRELADMLTVAVVSAGDATANEAQAVKAGVALMLLQPGGALSELYGVHATPSAVLIDPQGLVAQPLATGSAAIGELIPNSAPDSLKVSFNGDAHTDDHGARSNGSAPSSAGTAAARAAGAAAAVLAGIGSMAPVAEAADPERAAILAKINASEPHVVAHMRELQRATKRFAVLEPKPAARTAMLHAIVHARKDFSDLRRAVSGSRASTPAAVNARGLVLSSLNLLDQSFAKLEDAARIRNPGRSLRAVKAGRKLFDQAEQRSVDAQAALTQA